MNKAFSFDASGDVVWHIRIPKGHAWVRQVYHLSTKIQTGAAGVTVGRIAELAEQLALTSDEEIGQHIGQSMDAWMADEAVMFGEIVKLRQSEGKMPTDLSQDEAFAFLREALFAGTERRSGTAGGLFDLLGMMDQDDPQRFAYQRHLPAAAIVSRPLIMAAFVLNRLNDVLWQEVHDDLEINQDCLYEAQEGLRYFGMFEGWELDDEWDESRNDSVESVLKAQARAGALARLRKDPKQLDKALVRECWEAWQAKPESYPTQAAFARDMLTKCAHLVNTRTVEDWCREWGKAAASS